MRSIALSVVAILYGLANFYIGNRIINIVRPYFAFQISIFAYFLVFALALSSLVAYLQPTKNWKGIGATGVYWFGFVVLAFIIFGMTDILIFIINHVAKYGFSAKVLLILRIIDVIIIIMLYAIGNHTANRIEITPYEVTINCVNHKGSIKIAMFSDLHLGYINGAIRLEEIVVKINSINPDIVVIPGDFFDGNYYAVQEPQEIISWLRQIKSTYGTYLSWGNHDAGDTYEEMKKLIMSANITILEDEAITVDDKVVLVGRKDSSPIGNQGGGRTNIPYKPEGAGDCLPIIVLDHQPSNIEEYKHADLILSGHTHQGQVFPFSLITKKVFIVDYGYYQNNGIQIIVTSGVGTWGPPIRIGTKSEIVEITVTIE